MGSEPARVFLLSTESCDGALLQRVLQEIKERHGENSTLTLTFDHSPLAPSLLQHVLSLFRKYELHRSQRETVLSFDDQLICTQLCLAQLNKKSFGDFDVNTSDVMHTSRQLMDHRFAISRSDSEPNDLAPFLAVYDKFLRSNNITDWMNVALQFEKAIGSNEDLKKEVIDQRYLVIGSPSNSIERRLFSALLGGCSPYEVRLELPLDVSFTESNSSSAGKIIMQQGPLEELNNFMTSSPACQKPHSISELYVEKIFTDYLHLILNSCSELSLSRVLNVPDRSLDHVAFTHLKQEAEKKGVSMYQTAVSHVMRLRLGGKGYAPDPNSKLNRHVKGFSEFTDLMHKLSDVLEDDLNSQNALRRIVNILKNSILKNSALKPYIVKSVAEKVHLHLDDAVNEMERMNTKEDENQVGVRSLRALLVYIDSRYSCQPSTRIVDVLQDSFSTQGTPVRFPCLLSKFRSPLDYLTPKQKPLSERIIEKNTTPQHKIGPIPRFKANYDWNKNEGQAEAITCFSDEDPIADSSWNRPLAERILASKDDKENIPVDIIIDSSVAVETITKKTEVYEVLSPPKKKQAKRELKQVKCKEPKPAKPKKQKSARPLLKGQKSLTSFFK